jgi:hypothetical protein
MSDRPPEPVVDIFGHWHARVGFAHAVFATREEAIAAQREAPAPPTRAPRAPGIPPVDSKHLTMTKRGVVLRDARGRAIGAIVLAAGKHVLWWRGRRIGEFETAEAAAEAARL